MKAPEGVRFREGRRGDIPHIRRRAEEWRLDGERIETASLIVAEDREGRIVGFGRVKSYADFHELGMVGVEPAWRGRGLGAALVRALVKRFPSKDVWITTDITGYFERFGFETVAQGPAELHRKIETNGCCRERGNVRIMLLNKGGGWRKNTGRR